MVLGAFGLAGWLIRASSRVLREESTLCCWQLGMTSLRPTIRLHCRSRLFDPGAATLCASVARAARGTTPSTGLELRTRLTVIRVRSFKHLGLTAIPSRMPWTSSPIMRSSAIGPQPTTLWQLLLLPTVSRSRCCGQCAIASVRVGLTTRCRQTVASRPLLIVTDVSQTRAPSSSSRAVVSDW
jgi:hypothetical protein